MTRAIVTVPVIGIGKVACALLLSVVSALLSVSCVKEETLQDHGQTFGDEFCIVLNAGETKTEIDRSFKLHWSEGDSVHVFHSPSGTGETIDDGCFVFDGERDAFVGRLASELTAGESYGWVVRYPYGFDGKTLPQDMVGDGSAPGMLAGKYVPLEGCMEACPAEDVPCVTMKQMMSALQVRVINNVLDPFVPERIVFVPGDAGAVTLTLTGTDTVSWNNPGLYYMPVPPVTLKSGSGLALKVFMADGTCQAKELVLKEDITFAAGKITPVEIEAEPTKITREELFSEKNWAKVIEALETFQDCSIYSPNVKSIISQANSILSRMNEDGSWPDVDYRSTHQSNWSPTSHTGYIRDMARAYHITDDVKYLDACRKALEYWDKVRPVSQNWWYNEIYAPMTLAPAFLLLKDGLDKTDIERADRILSKAYLGLTGQNKLWMAGIVLERGLLLEDYDMVVAAYENIFSEIKITTDEGIQPDYSFHQHGKIMQTGLYGLVFAHDMAKWYSIFGGTPLAIRGEKKAILVNYIREGQDWLVWNRMYDPNAFGRQLMADKDVANYETLYQAHEYMDLKFNKPTGGRYYPYSNFGIYRTSLWYASLRMQSENLIGFENTLSENMQGYFASDGALLIRKTGEEYLDIWPVWNWKHVPGTTTYDNGKPLWGCSEYPPYNKTSKVFGQVCGDMMAVAMDYNRDGLTARKAWFFYENGIVCLGSGITMDKGYDVTTTVEQSILSGTPSMTDNWVRHHNISYINLGEGKFDVQYGERTGKWSSLCPDYEDTSVTKKVFEVVIDHGVDPHDASYAYGVAIMKETASDAYDRFIDEVKVVSNTASCQSVSINGTTLTVDWDSCTIL